MDWNEATTLGAAAARLIEDLTSLFEKLSEEGYLVTPPTWTGIEETEVRQGNTKRLVVIELDGRLQIAKIFEPVSGIGPPGSIEEASRRMTYGPGERVEVPSEIGSGPTIDPGIPRWVTPLDRQTCSACRTRHGLPYLNDAYQKICMKTEKEGGCRCFVNPPAHPPRPNSNKAGG